MRKDKNAYLTYEKVKKLASKIEFTDIIDLGCGDTKLLSQIKKIKFSNKNQINYVGAGFKVLKKDDHINVLDKLDFNTNDWFESVKQKFDLLLVLDVIEHLENPFLFLQQVKRICQSKAKLFITVPNIHSYRSRIKFFLTGRPSAFFNKEFRLSSNRNFDDHIWLPAIDLINYFLRCNNLSLKKFIIYMEIVFLQPILYY